MREIIVVRASAARGERAPPASDRGELLGLPSGNFVFRPVPKTRDPVSRNSRTATSNRPCCRPRRSSGLQVLAPDRFSQETRTAGTYTRNEPRRISEDVKMSNDAFYQFTFIYFSYVFITPRPSLIQWWNLQGGEGGKADLLISSNFHLIIIAGPYCPTYH